MNCIEESGEIDIELFKQILKRKNMPSTLSKKEQLSHKMYDDYCEAVGGKAFNGDPLPKSEEFFNDTNKTKQSAAWIVAAETAVRFILENLTIN